MLLMATDTFSFVTVALTMALARIATLEAELKTSAKALKDANATKVSTERVAKSVETRSKKAKKALADASQKQIKREQSLVKRLDEISTSVGSKCFILPLDIR
jgi:translation initiation factor 2B subunit (eIF-2B alpha/beta/delta family)